MLGSGNISAGVGAKASWSPSLGFFLRYLIEVSLVLVILFFTSKPFIATIGQLPSSGFPIASQVLPCIPHRKFVTHMHLVFGIEEDINTKRKLRASGEHFSQSTISVAKLNRLLGTIFAVDGGEPGRGAAQWGVW